MLLPFVKLNFTLSNLIDHQAREVWTRLDPFGPPPELCSFISDFLISKQETLRAPPLAR